MIELVEKDINCEDAKMLIGELNHVLEKITGASGAKSFKNDDVKNERSVFLIAYVDGIPMGCGAIKEISADIAEVKRVYAKPNHIGIGNAILTELEKRAKALRFSKLILETRKVNQNAVSFYRKNNYEVCDNYGKYVNRPEAICFQKLL